METSFTTDNLKTLLIFPFQDENWKKKIFIAVVVFWAGIFIIPIWFFMGYFYEIMRRVIVDREPPALPDWDNWGVLLKNGFRIFGVTLVFSLPYYIFLIPPFILLFQAFTLGNFRPEEYYLPLFNYPVMMTLMVVTMIGSIFSIFFMVVAVSHMVAKDEFAAALRVKEWWPILRSNVSGFIISFVLVVGVYWIATFVSQMFIYTIVLCFVFPIVISLTTIYLYLIGSVLFAQAYNEGVDKLQAQGESA